MLIKMALIFAFILIFSLGAAPINAEQSPIINNTPPTKQEAGKDTDNKGNPKTQEQNSTTSPTIVNPAPSPPLQINGDKKYHEYNKEKKTSWWNFSITDALLVIFTCGLVIVGLIQYRILKNTLFMKRAFIFLKDIDFKEIISHDNYKIATWQLFPRWENSGDTPTKDMTISVNCDVIDHKLPEDFSFPYTTQINIPMMIGPKANIVTEPIEFSEKNIDILDDIGKPYLNGFYRVYMWGEAKYHDRVGGKSQHITRFCVELIFTEQVIGGRRKPPVMTFNYYKTYNYAD